MEAGMDSMSSMELRKRLSANFKLELPATVAFDFPSIHTLAGHISSQLSSKEHAIAGMQHNA